MKLRDLTRRLNKNTHIDVKDLRTEEYISGTAQEFNMGKFGENILVRDVDYIQIDYSDRGIYVMVK